MTTSEQAALLVKHTAITTRVLNAMTGALFDEEVCPTCWKPGAETPCDVHKMAELKDSEIAELRRERDRLDRQIKNALTYVRQLIGSEEGQ